MVESMYHKSKCDSLLYDSLCNVLSLLVRWMLYQCSTLREVIRIVSCWDHQILRLAFATVLPVLPPPRRLTMFPTKTNAQCYCCNGPKVLKAMKLNTPFLTFIHTQHVCYYLHLALGPSQNLARNVFYSFFGLSFVLYFYNTWFMTGP